MIERLTELQGRVQSARAALEGLAERAARLRARLEAVPETAQPAPRAVEPAGTSFAPSDTAAAMPPGETSALASSLERLTKTAWVAVGSGAGANEGDDGRFVSDAWEIALISEEGK
jgi:hypothetical protein